MIASLEAIDHDKFRSELWYTHDDLINKTRMKDFICFIASVNSEPTAFLYGYDDVENPAGFFLDEVATRIEGKGIGKVLIVLALVYCYELGYTYVSLYTEDLDEKGRKLREFYEHLGFRYIETAPDKGVVMRYEIKDREIAKLYDRVMFSEGGPHPPYLSS